MHGFTAHLGSGRPPGRALDRAVFGVLAPLVGDAGVTDVFVNPGGEVWVDRGHGSELAHMRVPAAEARDVATRLIAGGDRHVDESKP